MAKLAAAITLARTSWNTFLRNARTSRNTIDVLSGQSLRSQTDGRTKSTGQIQFVWFTVGMKRAFVADILTGCRLVIAVIVAAVVGAQSLDWAAVLISVAWLTDFLDGRIARSTDQQTRLHAWDLRADAILGIGLLVGMAIGGYLAWWTVPILVGLLGGATQLLKNPSPAMLMLGLTYARFLWLMLFETKQFGWMPFAMLPVLAIFDWHRFIRVIMPAFFKSAAALLRGRAKSDMEPILDDWV